MKPKLIIIVLFIAVFFSSCGVYYGGGYVHRVRPVYHSVYRPIYVPMYNSVHYGGYHGGGHYGGGYRGGRR